MMFLECPEYLDERGAARCGLPAEVEYRYGMRSTDGVLESAKIRCPLGHWFSGTIESFTWDKGPDAPPLVRSRRDCPETHRSPATLPK